MLIDVVASQPDDSRRKMAPKPYLHITSPLGWLNDPCAPCYDPNTGLYHLFYQCNPNGVQWGDMSWGHATSEDLVSWKFGPQHTKLEPDTKYDQDGVFTGCMAPIAKDGSMTIFYSSICRLPFHWTNPAPRGSAGLSMATSTDGGETWVKSDINPVLKEEPEGLNVTGFRDPYLAEWESMDRLRGKHSLYGLISGGIQKIGPTTFIYAVDPSDLAKWEYLGPLTNFPERFEPSKKWDCNYGLNWECVNFMTLRHGDTARDLLILCSEGDVQREHLLQSNAENLPPSLPPRGCRSQQWIIGELEAKPSGMEMTYLYGGLLDHGVYYAANSFHDPRTNTRIVYGWIPEEDCTPEFVEAKGWNGCQALPRELWLEVKHNVVDSLNSPLSEITNFEFIRQPNGTQSALTMGIRPVEELKKIRATSLKSYTASPFALSSTSRKKITKTASPVWELASSILLPASRKDIRRIKAVGFHIRASTDLEVCTTVSFSPCKELLSVVRANSIFPGTISTSGTQKSSTQQDAKTGEKDENEPSSDIFNTCIEQGSLTLFYTKAENSILQGQQHQTRAEFEAKETKRHISRHDDMGKSSTENPTEIETEIEFELEPLELRIISDGDVLEIFANDRFALATMIYTGGDYESYGNIEAFVEYYNYCDDKANNSGCSKTTRSSSSTINKDRERCLLIPPTTVTNDVEDFYDDIVTTKATVNRSKTPVTTYGDSDDDDEKTIRDNTSNTTETTTQNRCQLQYTCDDGSSRKSREQINSNQKSEVEQDRRERGTDTKYYGAQGPAVKFESIQVWDGLGAGARYVGYEPDVVPEEVNMRRKSRGLSCF